MLFFLFAVAWVASGSKLHTDAETLELFDQFIVTYNKTYTDTEYAHRLAVFSANLDIAHQYDQQDPSPSGARYGITKFMDLSQTEFRSMYLTAQVDLSQKHLGPVLEFQLNETFAAENEELAKVNDQIFDWSQRGKTTAIYNQGQCGSCWAFSTTEQLESMWAIAGHPLTNLAMQQLVDCEHCSHGCAGGSPLCAWPYIGSVGLDSYASYPYVGQDMPCHYNPNSVAARIVNWGYVTNQGNENVMHSYLLNSGPMSVCVDASQWQYYQGGIVRSCGRQIDHCVQITGWDYSYNAWVVRNSWGANWGVNGYIAIAAGGDVCAIAQVPTSANCPR